MNEGRKWDLMCLCVSVWGSLMFWDRGLKAKIMFWPQIVPHPKGKGSQCGWQRAVFFKASVLLSAMPVLHVGGHRCMCASVMSGECTNMSTNRCMHEWLHMWYKYVFLNQCVYQYVRTGCKSNNNYIYYIQIWRKKIHCIRKAEGLFDILQLHLWTRFIALLLRWSARKKDSNTSRHASCVILGCNVEIKKMLIHCVKVDTIKVEAVRSPSPLVASNKPHGGIMSGQISLLYNKNRTTRKCD